MSVAHIVQNLVDRYADQFEKELIEETVKKEEAKPSKLLMVFTPSAIIALAALRS